MEQQRARPLRVSVPVWEEFVDQVPGNLYQRNRPTRVRWTLVVLGHQPALASAWLRCLRVFGQEAAQDRVFEESMFWIITRSLQCFY
jgi:hypothetical protein